VTKCKTKFCRNERAPGRTLCYKCKSRREKEINPIGYYYHRLRCRARRREKEFTLTKEEFRRFCEETNYLELKGNHWNKMTIDRIDHLRGYSYDNIRMISMSENSIKGNHEKVEVPF